MSEHPAFESVDLDDEPQGRPARTGVARIDAAIDAVAALDDQALDEHVAVFEAAHAELRSTLDDPGIDQTDAS